MRNCQVCGLCEDVSDSCLACGEASWLFSDVPADKPKKSGKKQPAPEAPAPEAPAPEAHGISDEEFAGELAYASEMELLALIGDEQLSPAWRDLVNAEIVKREAK